MSIFDTIRDFVSSVFTSSGNLDDYSGDATGTDLDDTDFGTSDAEGVFSGDFLDDYFVNLDDLDYLEDVIGERLTVSEGGEVMDGEHITTFYDAQSVIEYVSPAPSNVLRVYATVNEGGQWEYEVLRFPSE